MLKKVGSNFIKAYVLYTVYLTFKSLADIQYNAMRFVGVRYFLSCIVKKRKNPIMSNITRRNLAKTVAIVVRGRP